MTETMLNAAHEIGHFLVARRLKMPVTFISIVNGREFNPQISLRMGTKATLSENTDFTLAGWAAEAYFRSHDEGMEIFNRRRFIMKALPSGFGAGWPFGLITGGANDLARLREAGVSPLRLLMPLRRLVSLGRQIHAQKELSHALVRAIFIDTTMNGEWISALADGSPVTSQMRKDTFVMFVEACKPKKREREMSQ